MKPERIIPADILETAASAGEKPPLFYFGRRTGEVLPVVTTDDIVRQARSEAGIEDEPPFPEFGPIQPDPFDD